MALSLAGCVMVSLPVYASDVTEPGIQSITFKMSSFAIANQQFFYKTNMVL
ncbi:MAG TPA: hypothetical protein IAC41_05210 [Candidatus Merdenecus merdavium]|nr:hypothetical protein [Candidatus Merdenecus merdavium]